MHVASGRVVGRKRAAFPPRIFPLAVLSALGACNDSGAVGTAGTAEVAACERQIMAVYGLLNRCGFHPALSDAEKARVRTACGRALAAPGIAVSANSFDACTAKLEALPCDESLFSDTSCDLPPGTLEIGSACADDLQCQTSNCLRTAARPADGGTVDAEGCGKCAAVVAEGGSCTKGERCVKGTFCSGTTCVAGGTGKSGDPCAGYRQCESGLYCDSQSKKCAPARDIGGACTSGIECKRGLRCANKMCAAPAKEGDACNPQGLLDCGAALGCDPASSKCAKRRFAKSGEVCDGLVTFCEFGSCPAEATKVCPQILADGTACDSADRTRMCDFGASCRGGTCQLPDPAMCR